MQSYRINEIRDRNIDELIGIKVNDNHRALEDAKATLFVYSTSIRILYDK